MKNEQIQEFFTKVAQDERFKAEVLKFKEEREAKKLNEQDVQKFVEKVLLPKAKKLGYNFSEKDLADFGNSQELANLDKLSLEDLENVSGGVSAFVLGALALLGWLGFVSHANNAQPDVSKQLPSTSVSSSTCKEDNGPKAVEAVHELIDILKPVGLNIQNLSPEEKNTARELLEQVSKGLNREKNRFDASLNQYYIKGADGKVLYGYNENDSSGESLIHAKLLRAFDALYSSNWVFHARDCVHRAMVSLGDDYWKVFGVEHFSDIHSWRECVAKVCMLIEKAGNGEELSEDETDSWRVLVTRLGLACSSKFSIISLENGQNVLYGGTDNKDEQLLLQTLADFSMVFDGNLDDVNKYVNGVKTRLGKNYESLIIMGKQQASKPTTGWNVMKWFTHY